MKNIKLRRVSYSPGYSDMLGGYHSASLENDKYGKWTYVCQDRENHSAPTVTTVYKVAIDVAEQFEDFLSGKKILSLENRPKSDMFATDYSPWSWTIVYDTTSFGNIKREYCTIDEYKEYSGEDYEILKEMREMFTAMRGEKVSETIAK